MLLVYISLLQFFIRTCFAITGTGSSGTGLSGPPDYSTDLETELRTTLYNGYEVLQRPDQSVTVQVTLNFMALNDLDIKEQVMKISGYFSMQWTDSRLYWADNSTYDNINFLFSSETYTWRPAVIVENSMEELTVLSDKNVLMRILSTGQVSWSPSGIFVTSCESDVTYYPLDTQTCDVILSTWAYTSNEVSFLAPETSVDTTYYTQNGEWTYLGYSTTVQSSSRESQSFSRIIYTLTFRRRPLFHILNTILPVILMTILMTFVFKLPPDSGERIGLSLTTLLAYAVYLTLISDDIPQTSIHPSILSVYLILILSYSACSVTLTIWVLSVYFTPEEEKVPRWLQKFTECFLAKITCWKGMPCKFHQKVGPEDKIVFLTQEKIKETKSDTKVGFVDKKARLASVSSEESKTEKEYSWKDIALMMDKFFMYGTMVLVLVTTIATMAVLGSNY